LIQEGHHPGGVPLEILLRLDLRGSSDQEKHVGTLSSEFIEIGLVTCLTEPGEGKEGFPVLRITPWAAGEIDHRRPGWSKSRGHDGDWRTWDLGSDADANGAFV
jgi:hypothetical protein